MPDLCTTQAAADIAGELCCAVMMGEVTLLDRPACRGALARAGISLAGLPVGAFTEGAEVALRMIEGRARRALAFAEPRR